MQHGAGPELGCFATVDVAEGTPIWEFTGPTFTYAEMAERVLQPLVRPVVTSNVRELARVTGLKVENWVTD